MTVFSITKTRVGAVQGLPLLETSRDLTKRRADYSGVFKRRSAPRAQCSGAFNWGSARRLGRGLGKFERQNYAVPGFERVATCKKERQHI